MNIRLTAYINLLAEYLAQQRGKVLLLALLLLSNIGLQLLPPQLMRRFIDTATAGGALETLTRLAALVIGVVLVQQACSVLAAYLGEDVAWTATNRLRLDLADHCLHLDLSFHNAHTPGEMIERLDGDVTTLANFFSQVVTLVVGNLLLLVGVLALLFQADWRVGLVGLALALVSLLTLARLRNLGISYAAAHRQANADLFAFLEERLGGLEEVRANGARDYVMQRFYALLRTVLHKSLWENWTFGLPNAAQTILITTGGALTLALCAWLYQQGRMSIGTVYLVFSYTAMLGAPVGAITRQMEELQRAGGSIVRLQELRSTQSRIQEADRVLCAPRLTAGYADGSLGCATHSVAVRFEQVTFGYEPGAPVLHDLSFQLQPGRKLGLLGRTGSGKSTLARLLLRLDTPQAGAIYLGEGDAPLTDIRHLSLQQLRRQVGLVTQQVQLFHASLRDNLTFWDQSVADAQLLQALEQVGLSGWLNGLPDGLESLIEAGGGGLSAGEAQLLALARLFLRDPGLVILDEASSRLDPATEARLEQAIDRLLTGRTAIIIAHRLATVQRADEVLLLDNGRILEYGPRLELAQDRNSRFFHLLQQA